MNKMVIPLTIKEEHSKLINKYEEAFHITNKIGEFKYQFIDFVTSKVERNNLKGFLFTSEYVEVSLYPSRRYVYFYTPNNKFLDIILNDENVNLYTLENTDFLRDLIILNGDYSDFENVENLFEIKDVNLLNQLIEILDNYIDYCNNYLNRLNTIPERFEIEHNNYIMNLERY